MATTCAGSENNRCLPHRRTSGPYRSPSTRLGPQRGVGSGYHTREVETFGSPLLDQNASREMFEEEVRGPVKAFEGESFSHKGKYWTIPPEVRYRGYTLKEPTLVPGPSGCRSNAGSRSTAAPSAPYFMAKYGATGLWHARGGLTWSGKVRVRRAARCLRS